MTNVDLETAQAIRADLTLNWRPRREVAQTVGISVSNLYRILRNETFSDPGFDPDQLAKPSRTPEDTRTTSKLTRLQVDEIRSRRQAQYIASRELAEQYGVGLHVIQSVLSNRTWTDPRYDPSSLRPKWTTGGGTSLRTEGVIYGLTCECGCSEGVKYVGQTTQDLKTRLRGHLQSAKYKKGRDFYTKKSIWIREHGAENIRAQVLEQNPKAGLDHAEVEWIQRLNTRSTGVNMAEGGFSGAGLKGSENPSAKLTEQDVEQILLDLAEPRATSRSVADKYGVTKTLILKIDNGTLWPDVPRPNGLNVLGQKRRVKK